MPDADHYEAFGSTSDDHVHLIVRAGAFDVLPRLVRDQGPWQLVRRGEIARLKPSIVDELAEHGYHLDRLPSAKFEPEEYLSGPRQRKATPRI